MAALGAQPVRVPEASGRDMGAVEEIAGVKTAVRGEGAFAAVNDVEDVDAVVFFWFAAAGEEGVGVVAHFWGLGGEVR